MLVKGATGRLLWKPYTIAWQNHVFYLSQSKSPYRYPLILLSAHWNTSSYAKATLYGFAQHAHTLSPWFQLRFIRHYNILISNDCRILIDLTLFGNTAIKPSPSNLRRSQDIWLDQRHEKQGIYAFVFEICLYWTNVCHWSLLTSNLFILNEYLSLKPSYFKFVDIRWIFVTEAFSFQICLCLMKICHWSLLTLFKNVEPC